MRQRKLTREDVAFILETKSEGVSMFYIAHYVYGVTPETLKQRLATWGVL